MKTLCPNCEKETECEFTAELYECKECGEDFAKYIVARKLPDEKSKENDARTSYGDFFDKAVIALGFSSAMLPGTKAETKMLKRISDLFWLVRKLSVAMDFVYERLPPDFPCLPVSYDEIKQRMKELK